MYMYILRPLPPPLLCNHQVQCCPRIVTVLQHTLKAGNKEGNTIVNTRRHTLGVFGGLVPRTDQALKVGGGGGGRTQRGMAATFCMVGFASWASMFMMVLWIQTLAPG